MTGINISRIPDQLITDILNYAQQTVAKTRHGKLPEAEVAALFQRVGQAMKELADALPDDSWKLQYLRSDIQDVREQSEHASPSLEKALPAFLKRIRDTANNTFRTLHPSPAGAHFIREGDHPIVKKEKDEICRDRAGSKQIWTIVQRNMAANKPDVVTAIVTSGNCLKLAPFQVMQIWEWAGDRFEVVGAVLNILWIPPRQLVHSVDRALQQNRFAAIAQPVIVHHFDRLSIPLQKRVQQWALENFPPTSEASSINEAALLAGLHDLASRLVIFLKRNGLQHKDPAPPAGSFKEQLPKYAYQLNFAFLTLLATNIRTHEKVEEAHALWKALRQELQQEPLPSGVMRGVETIGALVAAFPNVIRAQEEDADGFVVLSSPTGYGSMDTTSAGKKREAHRRAEEMTLALTAAFEADDPDAVTMDCMGLLLLEPAEFEALFAITCTKERSRVMERLWTLRPFFHLGSDQCWIIFKIFLSNGRYAEAEKILRHPSFQYAGARVLEISDLLKPDAPQSLTTFVSELVAQYLGAEEAPSNLLEKNLKALTAFLMQALLNNGWMKDCLAEPSMSEAFRVEVWVALIDQLLSAIPKDVKKRSVGNIQTKTWPALKAALEKDDLDLRAIQANFEEMMEQMFHFRKPLAEKDEYEAKFEERDPMLRLMEDFKDAVQRRNLTAIKREMEKLSNHMESITPAIVSQVLDLLTAIPVDDLARLAREELGDQVTEDSVQASIGQFFDMLQMFRVSLTVPRAPAIPSGFAGGSSLLSDLTADIQQQNWESVQKRVETFFQTATGNDRSTIMAIGRLLAPTPLEDLKMMIAMQLLD